MSKTKKHEVTDERPKHKHPEDKEVKTFQEIEFRNQRVRIK